MREPVTPLIAPSHSSQKDSPRPQNPIPYPLSPIPPKIPWPATWTLLLSLSALLNALFTLAAHGARGFFLPILATAICLLAALFDACTKRIPNPLTYTAILLGLALNATAALLSLTHAHTPLLWLAAPGLSQSLLGFAACAFLATLGLFARVGGGDLKLLVALGALLGLSNTGDVLFFALSIALLYALLNLALSNRLNSLLSLLALRLLEAFYFRRLDLPFPEDDPNAPSSIRKHIPMAVPLALGLLLSQFLSLQSILGAPR